MGLSKVATVFFMGFILLQTACASERIFDVGAKAYVTRAAMLDRIGRATDVVVGEKHDTASVQNAEARLFADFANGRRTRVTFAWEFWNWSERAKLDSNYAKFRDGSLSSREFLRAVFGDKNPEATYAPLMDAVKAAGADLLATNLSRNEKSPVVSRGIGALDPKLLPPGFAVGGPEYRERFFAEMGGHGDPAELENYFAAQSLVDDVAAFHFVEHRMTPSAFLLIGNFHTRYFDGVWRRIAIRSPGHSRVLVEIADPEDETNWQTVVQNPKYGSLADFVIFTR